MLFRVVGFGIDDFRRCLTSYGVVETVLDHCIEISRGLCVAVIVNAALSIDVCNLFSINFSLLDLVYDCFHFGNCQHMNQANLIHIRYYCEKITKVEFIFACIKDFPYICQKRKEETL